MAKQKVTDDGQDKHFEAIQDRLIRKADGTVVPAPIGPSVDEVLTQAKKSNTK